MRPALYGRAELWLGLHGVFHIVSRAERTEDVEEQEATNDDNDDDDNNDDDDDG